MGKLHNWEVWYPKAGATGLLMARGLCEPTLRMLFHSPADFLTVEVYDDDRLLVAKGMDLPRTLRSPMCLLRIEGEQVVREDMWPAEADNGTPVLLPGGEVCILTKWWNSEDRMEWRWSGEFYNSNRG